MSKEKFEVEELSFDEESYEANVKNIQIRKEDDIHTCIFRGLKDDENYTVLDTSPTKVFETRSHLFFGKNDKHSSRSIPGALNMPISKLLDDEGVPLMGKYLMKPILRYKFDEDRNFCIFDPVNAPLTHLIFR